MNIAFLIAYGASLMWAIISVADSGYSVHVVSVMVIRKLTISYS